MLSRPCHSHILSISPFDRFLTSLTWPASETTEFYLPFLWIRPNEKIKVLQLMRIFGGSHLLYHKTTTQSATRGGCRVHWQQICSGVRTPPNDCPGYDIKPWWSSSLRPLENVEYLFITITPSTIIPGVILPVRVTFMGQVGLFNNSTACKQMTDVKLNC